MLENGRWVGWKPEETWNLVSDSAKNLVKGMLNPDAGTRFTVHQCLEHSWIKDNASMGSTTNIRGSASTYEAVNEIERKQNAINNAVIKDANTIDQSNVRPSQDTSDFKRMLVRIIGGEIIHKEHGHKPSTYLVLWCGSEKQKTKVQNHTFEPSWDETWTLIDGRALQHEIMHVECWNFNKIGKDHFMGEFQIDVSRVPVGTSVATYNLVDNAIRHKHKHHHSSKHHHANELPDIFHISVTNNSDEKIYGSIQLEITKK